VILFDAAADLGRPGPPRFFCCSGVRFGRAVGFGHQEEPRRHKW
jgi:hypothetical protein